MALQTRGFDLSVYPRYTPVDPVLATRDPNAFLRGLTTTTTALDQLGDLPRQRKLRDLELAQEEAKLADIPSRRRLQDLQLQELERRARIADLAPTEPAYKAISPLGDLVEYQERGNVDPATGVPYGIAEKPTMYESLIKTKEQLDQEARAAGALAQYRTDQGQAALDRASTEKNRVSRYYNYDDNTVMERVTAPDGSVLEDRIVPGATPPPRSQGAGGGGLLEGELGLTPQGAATATPVAAPVGTTVPGAATAPVAGIDKPFDIAIPRGSFSNENEANAAAAAVAGTPQAFKPGDVVIINGVRHFWRED